jgi:hypothetical protein
MLCVCDRRYRAYFEQLFEEEEDFSVVEESKWSSPPA